MKGKVAGTKKQVSPFEAVVIGASAGGLQALGMILSSLPADFAPSVIVVQHLHPETGGYLPELLSGKCRLPVKEAADKEPVRGASVYLAPADYHLLVERERFFSLSVDGRVNFSRPSIDVLFESAADVYRSKLVGIILTGANADGSRGLGMVKERGGLALVQDPRTAEAQMMPRAAMAAADHILALREIGPFLVKLCRGNQ